MFAFNQLITIQRMAKKIVKFKNAWSSFKDGTMTFYVTGFINDWLFDYFLDDFNNYKPSKIKIVLFTYGGYLDPAIAVRDFILAKGLEVETDTYGACASAGTVLACLGKTRVSPSSYWLIHHVADQNNVDTDEARESQKALNDNLVKIYMEKTGKSEEWVLDQMDKGENSGIIMSEQLIEYGFADEIITPAASMAALLEVGKLAASNLQPKNNISIIKKNNMDFSFVNKMLESLGLETKIKTQGDFDSAIEDLKGKFENNIQKNTKFEADFASITTSLKAVNDQLEALKKVDVTANIKTATDALEVLIQEKAEARSQASTEAMEAFTTKFENQVATMANAIATMGGDVSGINDDGGEGQKPNTHGMGDPKPGTKKITAAAFDMKKYLNAPVGTL